MKWFKNILNSTLKYWNITGQSVPIPRHSQTSTKNGDFGNLELLSLEILSYRSYRSFVTYLYCDLTAK